MTDEVPTFTLKWVEGFGGYKPLTALVATSPCGYGLTRFFDKPIGSVTGKPALEAEVLRDAAAHYPGPTLVEAGPRPCPTCGQVMPEGDAK